jgi:hypothetical protein
VVSWLLLHKSLRADPRFAAMLVKLKLPP